jgi:ADP-ribose diphosphatase
MANDQFPITNGSTHTRRAVGECPGGLPLGIGDWDLAIPTRTLEYMIMKESALARTPWQKLSSRRIYANRWMAVREDQVQLPNGRQTIYGVVDCGSCVGVLPLVDPGHVLLVGQYRYVAQRFTWEMPTGGVRPEESLEAAAQRELAEEAGQCAGRLTWVSTYHTSKSVMNETAHLYVGEDLAPADHSPDDTEFIERRIFNFQEVVEMVRRAEITDSMTVIAVLQVALRRWERGSGDVDFSLASE